MDNTFFFSKDNNVSSKRSRGNGIDFSTYTGRDGIGGVTFHAGGLTSRFSQSGNFMGSGFKTSGNSNVYINSSSGITDRLKEFK